MSLDMPQSPREAHESVATLCRGCHAPIPPGRKRGSERRHCSPECRRRAWDAANRPRVQPRQAVLPGESRVEREFAQWVETPAGRHVEAEVVRLAREDKADGESRGEVNYYFAKIRRESRHLTKDRRGFRCNHNHRKYLAERVMERNADLAGFFKTRERGGVR